MPPVHPTSRADRLDLLLRMIGDRPGVTAGEAAHDLGQSVRTIFRDIDALRRRGYPIESSRGRGGGLRLSPRWGLGRVTLSRDEALGTLLALAVSSQVGFPLFGNDIARARRRIVDAFPSDERRRLAPLRDRILVGAPASAAVRRSYAEPEPECMRALQRGFIEARQLHVTYRAEGGALSARPIEPQALVINWPAWYVLAYDHLREAPRTFRVDRFHRVRAEGERFTPWGRTRVLELLGELGVVLERV
jgi:predicted DNA-binding transcriptional regulator YafY